MPLLSPGRRHGIVAMVAAIADKMGKSAVSIGSDVYEDVLLTGTNGAASGIA